MGSRAGTNPSPLSTEAGAPGPEPSSRRPWPLRRGVVLGLLFGTGIAAFAFACGSDPTPECAEQGCADAGADTSSSSDAGLDSTLAPDAKDATSDAQDASDASDAESECPGPAGTLDPTFGDGGIVWLKYPGGEGRGVVVQPDGRTVLVGTTYAGVGQLTLIRLMPDGSLDTSFGSNGLVERQLADTSSLLSAVAVQPDGRIVATGFARSSGELFNFVVLRLLSDGRPDSAFGDAGVARAPFPNREAYPQSLQIDKVGRILVGGLSEDPVSPTGSADYEIVRFGADGTLDTTFGTDGHARFDVHGTTDSPGILLQRVGGLAIAGGTSKSNSPTSLTDFTVVGALDDGSIDPSFGTAGVFSTNVDAGRWTARAMASDATGRIVVAGFTGMDFALVRLSSSGGLDSTFGTGGMLTTDFSSRADDAFSVLIQGDGKIVAAGGSGSPNPDRSMALARYMDDGGLDPTFGDGGRTLTAPPANEAYDIHAAALSRCSITVTGDWVYNITPTTRRNGIGVARYRR